MFWNITNRDGQQTLSVIGEDFEKTIPSTHPNYIVLAEYLTTHPAYNEEYVRGLVDPSITLGKQLQAEFGSRVTFDLHNVFLDGQKVDGPLRRLGEVIKTNLLSGGNDWVRFIRFLVNLDNNPSKRAKDAVWAWIEANGLTVTEDGRFLGYKAVLDSGLSSSAGPMNYVNGVLLNNGEHCQVPNEVGSVISKKRADVDDTPGGGCSVGLHVGTLEYASHFAPRLMTVAVDPADVVSVPDRDLNWKIRVCKYEVISLADPKQFEDAAYNLHQDEEEPAPFTPIPDGNEADVEEAHEEQDANVNDDDQSYLDDFHGEDEDVDDASQEPTQEPSSDLTLAENAALVEDLHRDLHDASLGHKPLARKWSHLTTEASVRRYRKSNGVSLRLSAKVKDAVS